MVMVHFCCVPGCSNDSTKTQFSFFSLPLKRKSVLKQWIHAIGRKNLTVNAHTRVCSEHFVHANGRLLRPDEIPSLKIPSSSRQRKSRKPPKDRSSLVNSSKFSDRAEVPAQQDPVTVDASVQTGRVLSAEEIALLDKVNELEMAIKEIDKQRCKQRFSIMNMKDDNGQVLYYTGFKSYDVFEAFF